MRNINLQTWRALARAVNGDGAGLAGLDDAELLRDAAQHGVAQLLHSQAAAGALPQLSDDVRARLADAARQQAAQDLLLNAATREFCDLLAAEGIPALLLKGTPVAHLYYRQTWQRPRCDTDVYINDCDVERAMAALRRAGYAIGGQLGRKHSSKQFVAGIRRFQDIYSSFDVHWKLSNRVLFQATLPFADCHEARQAVPALGRNAWTLSTADLLLHSCIHRIGHGRGSDRDRLVWLYDIHLLWAALGEAGQEAFVDRALDRQVGVLCADALQVAEDLFGNHVGAVSAAMDRLEKLRSNRRREPTARLIEAGKLRWLLADWLAVQGLRAKVAYAREVLFDR